MLVFEHLATIPFPIIRGKPSYIFYRALLCRKRPYCSAVDGIVPTGLCLGVSLSYRKQESINALITLHQRFDTRETTL